MAQKLFFLALAGGVGTLARYGLAGFIQKIHSKNFPVGTMVVNILGCLVVGILWTLFETKWEVSPETKLLVLVGFMGAFTTFSAFILETSHLVRSTAWMYAAINLILQNTLGLIALFGGITIGRSL